MDCWDEMIAPLYDLSCGLSIYSVPIAVPAAVVPPSRYGSQRMCPNDYIPSQKNYLNPRLKPSLALMAVDSPHIARPLPLEAATSVGRRHKAWTGQRHATAQAGMAVCIHGT